MILLSDNSDRNGGGYRITHENLDYLYKKKKRESNEKINFSIFSNRPFLCHNTTSYERR